MREKVHGEKVHGEGQAIVFDQGRRSLVKGQAVWVVLVNLSSLGRCGPRISLLSQSPFSEFASFARTRRDYTRTPRATVIHEDGDVHVHAHLLQLREYHGGGDCCGDGEGEGLFGGGHPGVTVEEGGVVGAG